VAGVKAADTAPAASSTVALTSAANAPLDASALMSALTKLVCWTFGNSISTVWTLSRTPQSAQGRRAPMSVAALIATRRRPDVRSITPDVLRAV
jgi:hypothetical protein